jgi:hypothetical protein
MVLYNNPPQPVPTVIRNAVTYQDRVSMLLNGAGSSKQNPIQSKNPGGVDTVGANGYSFRLSFAMADATETITSAVASLAYDSGETYGQSVSFKNSISSSTATYLFTASLHIGGDYPSISTPDQVDGEAQLVVISITTSLGRKINQQVWVAREPSDMVTLDGQVTTSSSPLRLSAESFTNPVSIPFSVQFYPTWNDEIARQHGANTAALSSNVRKPYGGAVTVEVVKDDVNNTVVLAETPIENVTTITETVAAAGSVTYIFKFRSKLNSSTYLSKRAWVEFYECPTGSGGGGTSNPPPVIQTGQGEDDDPPDDVIYDPDAATPAISFWLQSLGGETTASFHFAGYKGNHFNNGGSYLPMAGYNAGSGVITGVRNEGQTKTITIAELQNATPGLDPDAQMILGYLKTANGRSRTLLFKRNDLQANNAEPTDYPKPPVVSNVSLTFSTGSLSFTLGTNGWDADATVSVEVTPLTAEITSGGNSGSDAQVLGDMFVNSGTSSTQTVTSAGTKALTFTNVQATTEAVAIKISNADGVATGGSLTIINPLFSSKQAHTGIKLGPTIATNGVAFNGQSVEIDLDDTGYQASGSFLIYGQMVYDTQGGVQQRSGTTSTAVTYSASSPNLTTSFSSMNLTSQSGAYYIFVVIGEQGSSVPYELAT